MLQSVGIHEHVALAISALWVCQGAPEQSEDVFLVERLELENARSADESLDDVEIGVLGSCANESEQARFHVWQEGILLGFIPAVHLVDEKDRTPAVKAAPFDGIFDDLA